MDTLALASNKRLSDVQLAKLAAFLSASSAKTKAMSLTQAHGFLCAVSSSPNLIMPSQWQPLVFGGEPEFASMEEAREIIGSLVQLNNYIVHQLRHSRLSLVLWEQDHNIPLKKCSFELLAAWCKGYLQGARLDATWNDDKESFALLLPFGILAGEVDMQGEENLDGSIITDDTVFKEQCRKNFLGYIFENFYYWENYRNNPLASYEPQQPIQREAYKVGRNDPCPCGSGKKYKKCCIDLPIDLH